MKNIVLLIASFISVFSLNAQDVKDVFASSKTPLEFVGLDFSNAKMVGSEGFTDPGKIQGYYFNTWNGLLLSERDKYDVKRAFMKREVDYNLSIVDEVNSEVDFGELVTNSAPKFFSEEKLQAIVNKYDTKTMSAPYGLSFVVHSFNKFQERAYIYVVVFDTKSKKILFSDKMSGEAGGFGFRNYWARTVYNILEDIQDYKFRRWKKENI